MSKDTDSKVKTTEAKFKYYTVSEDGLHLRVERVTLDITVTETDDDIRPDKIHMVCRETGKELIQIDTHGWKMIGERDYVAVHGWGAWARNTDLNECLKTIISESGATKAESRALGFLRGLRVWQCAKGTGWVDGYGGMNGVCTTPVDFGEWSYRLWEIVQPKKKG